MKKLRKRQFQKTVHGPKLTDDQLDDIDATIAFYIANVLRRDLIRNMSRRKSRFGKQEIARNYPHLSKKDIAHISGILRSPSPKYNDLEQVVAKCHPDWTQEYIISMAKILLAVLTDDGNDEDAKKMMKSFEEIFAEYIFESSNPSPKRKNLEQVLAEYHLGWSRDLFISMAKILLTSDSDDKDTKKMLWAFEEIAAGHPHHPKVFLFKKLFEAMEKKDMKGKEEWRKKINEIDESLVKSYYNKLDEGIQLFAENFFSISHVFVDLQKQ